MKVGGSIQKRCTNCKIVLRKGRHGGKVPHIICSNRRHRQRQG